MADEIPWTPVGKEPVDDQGWVPVAPPESGYIAGGLRSIYRGLAEIPRAAGDALEYNPEYLASGDSTATRDASKLSFLNQAGKVLSDVSESAKEVVTPAVYGTNEIKRSVFQGVESAPLSLAYKIPGYVGAVAAGTLGSVTGPGSLLTAAAGAAVAQAPVAAVMYRATAQQNMEDLDKAQSDGTLKPGITNAQKLATAQAMAHQEWIGESVSDVAENVMFSKLPFLGAAVKSAKGVLTPGLKSFAKTYAGVWVAEQTGEGYTAATQAALKNEILPADQQQTPWDAVKYQAGPTTVMTLLFTGAGHAGSSFKGRGITKYLEDDNTPADVRLQLASIVASRLKESNGPEAALNFMDHAADAIANKSTPSRLDLNDPALLTPYKPVDDTPATPLEQSGQDALDALKARVNPDNDIDTTDAAVAHVEEVKSAQTEAELNLQTATENLVKKMATPPPEPVTPETATPETFNPLKVSTTPAEALDYQRATGDTAYEVVRKDGKFVFEKTLETLKAEGYATTPSGNPFQSKAAAEKRIDLEQYEAVPFKKGWVGKPKIFLHQADVHAEELAKTLVEGGIAADDPVYAKIINERRTRERVPDPQTGLIAREHHNPTLERAVKEGRDFGYADVDLTNLGGLNEWAGGIEQANPYMRDIAQILVNTVQSAYPTAQVFRKGGDEFGVIAPGTNSKKLDVVLAKAQEDVKAYTISNGLSEIPHTKKGNPSGVGITYGTADTKGKSSTDVLKIADARTAKSKQALKEAYNVDAKLVGAVEAESLEGQTQRVVEGVGQDNSGQRETAAQVKRPEPVTPETVSKPEAEAAFNKEYTARFLKGDFRGAFEGHSDDMIDEYAADPANQAVFNMDAEDLAEHLTTLADGIKERASKNVKFAVKGDENVSADKRGLSDGVLRGDADVGTQGARSVATQGVEKGSPDTVEGRTLVEASIKRSIATHAGTTPEAVQLSLVPNVGDYKVANAIARLFGKYVYTADTAEDASLGDAFVSGSHPDAIFISKNTDKPVFTLLGHELLHKLAAENSELYNKFKLYIEANNKSSVAEKYKAGLKKISQYSTLDDTGITEEYLGNVVGHMFVQQSFWEKLARTEPTLFARILNILRDMLQTIKSNFQGAASTLKDVNEAETVTAKVFAKYARLYSEGKFSVDITNPDVRFSAASEAGATTEGQKERAAKMWAEKGVESPFFKKWFGKSKVVDGAGKPLVVYHGTGSKEKFNIFNEWAPNFFSADKKYADVYKTKGGGKGRQYAVYLAVEKPFDTLNAEALKFYNETFVPFWTEHYPSAIKPSPWLLKEGQQVPFAWADELFSFLRRTNREAGKTLYDGIYVDEGGVPAMVGSEVAYAIVPLHSTQIKSATDNNGEFDITNPDIRFSASEEARPWYSKLENLFTERLKSVKQEKTLPRSHFESILKDKNLKADEIKASGIEEFLKTKERFTAKEVQDELKANAVQLHDVVLGEPSFEPWSVYDSQDRFVKSVDSKDKAQALANEIGGNIAAPNGTVEPPPTHFSQYQEPGSVEGSYREMFVTAPSNKTDFKYKENGEPVFDSQGNAVREPVNTWQDGHSQYSDIQNPVVRIRFNEREVDGKRILFVEEMQGPSDANQKKMPDYLSKRIYDLGVKRVLSYAKENGFDGVAWTPGEMQAKRYDLSKQVDKIEYWDQQDHMSASGKQSKYVGIDMGSHGIQGIEVDPKTGEVLWAYGQSSLVGKSLDEVVGKELAKRILAAEGTGEISREGLSVGGEGLKSLYDKTLPSLFKKYGKEAVGDVRIGTLNQTMNPDVVRAENLIRQQSGEPLLQASQTVPYIPVTAATPSSQMKFSASLNDPIKAAKGLNDFFKKIPYSQIATDAANKIYQFVIPVDRTVTLAASQKTYTPIKSLLNQFIRQRKEKAGRIQSDMTNGAHIWKRFEKQFKTDAEVQNFSDMVWNATEYELHADPAIASPWNDASWEKSGMLKRTGKTLGEAQKIVSDQYRKLTPDQKTVHLEMLHHVQQMYQAGRQAELAWLDPAKVREAEAWLQDEVDNTFNKVEKPELVDLVRDIDEHYPTLRGDYMPMMRFGDLIVRTYEADKNGELGARMRTDFFNSPEDARKFIEAVNSNNTSYQNELKAAGDDVAAQAAVREKYKDYNLKHAKIETNPEYRKDVVNIPASLVDKISKAAANQGITGDALEELKQSIEGIRANLLPRTSTKGSKLHREGVAGYERDVVRVYLTYVRNHALANAQLTHGAKIEQTFRDMRNKIDAVASEPDYDVDAVRRMGELADHLYGVEKAGSREKVNEFTKTVGKITFAWYLASPSVFAVQWSQPFMVTIPKMGARHGFGKAFAAYTKAAKQYLHGEFSDDKIDEFDRKHEYVGQRVTDILDRSRDARGAERVQLDKELKEIYNSFGGAEKRLLILKVLSHQGQIDLAMSHNAADVVAGATADTKALNWIVDKGAFFMQKSETGSRRAAAISAFELQFNGDNFTEANDYATHIISDTLMDFDAQNRGAAWRGNTGRIIGQFQFFRMHMVGKLAQLTKDAIGGEYKRAMAEATTQEEKDAAMKAMKEARKEFAYVMGSSFALAGAMGTPLAVLMGNTGMSAIWAALAAVFGDDDDPWDPKRDFELAVREALGDTFGNVVLKGLPSLIGADLSRRIGLGGMGDIIQGDPPAGLTPTAKANWYAGRILGPSWGVISDTIRSADALADGDLAGAFKAGSPKIMRDVAKMFGVADKGVEAGGKTILKPEDVSVWSMALMFSGINPMEVALASEESRYLKNISTELSQRRSMLLNHLAEATVDQDLDAKEAAIEKINKFSETQPMLKITQQELVRKIKKIRDGREGKLSKRETLIQEEFGKN